VIGGNALATLWQRFGKHFELPMRKHLPILSWLRKPLAANKRQAYYLTKQGVSI
jgi:hypothetical protein